MANREFFYFYAPTWDYPPDGPIKLGNIIMSVRKPQRPLFCAPPEYSAVFSTKKKSAQYSKEKLRHGKFSVLTRFFSFVGFGAALGAEIDKSDEETFIFDTIETTQFSPTLSYCQMCIENDNVRCFLKLSRYRKPVYVITGVKVVKGAEANTAKSRAAGGAAHVPAGTAPEIKGKFGTKSQTKWEGGSDFVFAFRVSKIWAKEATGQVASEEEYRKGALLGDEADKVEVPELVVVKMEQVDVQVEGFDIEELMDDEEVVLCAISRDEDSDN